MGMLRCYIFFLNVYRKYEMDTRQVHEQSLVDGAENIATVSEAGTECFMGSSFS